MPFAFQALSPALGASTGQPQEIYGNSFSSSLLKKKLEEFLWKLFFGMARENDQKSQTRKPSVIVKT